MKRRPFRSLLLTALAALLAPALITAACAKSEMLAPVGVSPVTTATSFSDESQPESAPAEEDDAHAFNGAKDVASKTVGAAVPSAKPAPSPDLGVLGPASGSGASASARGNAMTKAREVRPRALESAKEKSYAHDLAYDARGPMNPAKAPLLAPRPRPRDVDGDGKESNFVEGGALVSAGTNPLVDPNVDALSTFAIDVDTGSYTLATRYLQNGAMPPSAGVRVEEWVNAFHYSYDDNAREHPFSIHMEGAPLSKRSYVMRIGIQGKRIEKAERAPVHLTFLVDVSGSMSPQDRLPLAKRSLALLVDELGPKDSVGLVTYAGDTRIVLPATAVTNANRARIKAAIEDLRNGGGTAMGSGMELAYREAGKALGDKGISRVIVLSDGDANIGRTSHQEMLKSIKGYVSEGVTMSTVGFGTGNLRDHLMEQLANAGNGNYSYVGNIKDAKRIFVDDLTGTLQVIAKDTKIQVEMNKDVVASYRLIGYENRDVADKDFRNDKVDAGEIGAGHTVTALYEVNLKDEDTTSDIATVRVRYKQPRGDNATEVSARFAASAMKHDVKDLSTDGKFALGVGLTAEVFRHSEHMDRLGIGLADAHALLVQGAHGPHAAERNELVRLIAPLAAGDNVAKR